MPSTGTPNPQPHRSQLPVVLWLGIVPNLVLLVLGLLAVAFGFTFVLFVLFAAGLNPLRVYLIGLVLSAFNLLALSRQARRPRPKIFWFALVLNAGYILLLLWNWKAYIDRPGQLVHKVSTSGLLVSGLSTIVALVYARMTALGPARFGLRSLIVGLSAIAMFLAAARLVLHVPDLEKYGLQVRLADRLEARGGIVGWRLWQVTWIDVRGCPIHDKDLNILFTMTNLKSFDGSQTQLTSYAMEYFASSSQLRELALDDTSLNNAGLAHLTSLKSLRTLQLRRTRVTREGIDWLHRRLPNCRIYGTSAGQDYTVGP